MRMVRGEEQKDIRFELRIESPNEAGTFFVLKTSRGDVPSTGLYRDLEQLGAYGFPVTIWQVVAESHMVSRRETRHGNYTGNYTP